MKKILILLAGLIVLIVGVIGVLIFVTPTEFKVEREIEINKPKSEVFSYLTEMKNQEKWGPWLKKDPNAKLTYTGTDTEVGFISKWESDHPDVGNGEQEIKKITDGEQIDVEVRFKAPFEATSQSYFKTADSGADKTNVKWGFTGSMPRPMNLMLLFIDMNAEVGKDFDSGLKSLKEIMEKAKAEESTEKAEESTDL